MPEVSREYNVNNVVVQLLLTDIHKSVLTNLKNHDINFEMLLRLIHGFMTNPENYITENVIQYITNNINYDSFKWVFDINTSVEEDVLQTVIIEDETYQWFIHHDENHGYRTIKLILPRTEAVNERFPKLDVNVWAVCNNTTDFNDFDDGVELKIDPAITKSEETFSDELHKVITVYFDDQTNIQGTHIKLILG